jgi:ATP synthase protein I
VTPRKQEGLADTVRSIGALSSVGISFVLAIVIGAGTGYFLMTRFGLGRWVFLLFFVFGVVAGILNVYRTAGRLLK